MDERYDMRRERVGGIHLPSDGKRDTTEKVKANWLFYSFVGVFALGTIAFIVWIFNIDLPTQSGKYSEGGDSTLMPLILVYWGGAIVLFFVYSLVSRLVLDIDLEEYRDLVIKMVLFVGCSFFIILPISMKGNALYNDAVAHNDAVTIEKLETSYDSVKKLDPGDSLLDGLPRGDNESDIYPYLVKKDGEPYVLYVSRDIDKNTTTVISEIKVSKDGASVKVIE